MKKIKDAKGDPKTSNYYTQKNLKCICPVMRSGLGIAELNAFAESQLDTIAECFAENPSVVPKNAVCIKLSVSQLLCNILN